MLLGPGARARASRRAGGAPAAASSRACARTCAAPAARSPRASTSSPSTRNDDGVWERLEELLIAADVGVPATVEIVQALEAEAAAGRLHTPEELRDALQRIVAERLAQPLERRALDLRAEPAVILVVGVNGTGKTTTIGKLAYQLHEAGRERRDRRRRHVPGGRRRAARDLGRARAGRLRRLGQRLRSGRRRLRRRQRRASRAAAAS